MSGLVPQAFARRGASVCCGSLAFPVPRLPWASADAEQLPLPTLHRVPVTPLRRDRSARYPCRRRPKPTPFRVPLLEFLKDHPSTDITMCVHSRLPGFGIATPERVPPLSFLPTSAACSAHGFAGLFHPAAGHGVRLVSRRPSTFAERPTLLRGVPSPSELFAGPAGRPVARLPASSPLVRGDRSHRFPRPRGLLPIRSSTRQMSPPAGTSSLGFPRPRLSPEHPVAEGSFWFPSCPMVRIGFARCAQRIGSPHGGRRVRRERLPVHPPCGRGP